jgi:hypothetical protein
MNLKARQVLDVTPSVAGIAAVCGVLLRLGYPSSTGNLGFYLAYGGVTLCLVASGASMAVADKKHNRNNLYYINCIWFGVSVLMVIGFLVVYYWAQNFNLGPNGF